MSVVDHFNRTAKDTKKRVVGVLLGDVSKGQCDVSNSFALPFEEDDKDPSIWFLDHSYLEGMYKMFKKVNGEIKPAPPRLSAPLDLLSHSPSPLPAREKVVGWYSTGPKLKEADLDINALLSRFTETGDPVLVICEVQPKEMGLPFTAYYSVDEVRPDGTEKAKKVFVSIPTEVGQTEAEEIGVEHLLRDVKDATISTLASDVSDKLQALHGLKSRLEEIQDYMSLVIEGKLPINHDILGYLQDIFNLLPNMNVEALSRAIAVKTNDMSLAIYISSMIRSILALHKLIDNKERLLHAEKDKEVEKANLAKKLEEASKAKAAVSSA